jgi:type VI secretion system protein ImpE
MKLNEFLERGDLDGLVQAATAAVRERPLDPAARLVLAESLCLIGDFDRAEKIAIAAGSLRKEPSPGVILLRNLLRAEIMREQLYREGRPPELRWDASEELASQLGVVVDLRAGDAATAAAALVKATGAADCISGVLVRPDQPDIEFAGFRDLDDRNAAIVEACSASGQFYWLPWNQFQSIRFEKPQTMRDLLWRPATCGFVDGGEGHYFLPALYPLSSGASDPAARLGQSTLWQELGAGLIGGVGQRMLLAGDECCGLLDIQEIRFHQPG